MGMRTMREQGVDPKDKIADWVVCDNCKGSPRGCSHCSQENPGYVLVPR